MTKLDGLIYEPLNPHDLNEKDLRNLYEIEKDSIGYFYEEYKICNGCGKIYNKKDVFASKDPNFMNHSISELEKMFGKEFITPCCKEDSREYRPESQIEDIRERLLMGVHSTLNGQNSHCNIIRDKVGGIIGFCYGYTDNLASIYEREFRYHFTPKMLQNNILSQYQKETFITICGAFCFQKYMQNNRAALKILMQLFQHFFMTLDDSLSNAVGIFEGKDNSATKKLFEKMGATALQLHSDHENYVKQKADGTKLLQNYDILVHEGIAHDYLHKVRRF